MGKPHFPRLFNTLNSEMASSECWAEEIARLARRDHRLQKTKDCRDLVQNARQLAIEQLVPGNQRHHPSDVEAVDEQCCSEHAQSATWTAPP